MSKLIVISVDALIYEDIAYMKQLPNMGAFLKKSAVVKRVRSVFPSLTYPCHATMRTGCYPQKHGILHNNYVIPGDADPHWLWYQDAVKCRDLFDACKEKGLTTAAVGWPTTGNHPNIDYLVDEVANLKVKTREAFHGYYTSTGTSAELYEIAVEPNIHHRCGASDNVRMFNAEAACSIIRSKQPDLLMLHLGEPDSTRHKFGVFSHKLYEVLRDVDGMLGRVLGAASDTGETYNIVITSDHGQLDTTRTAFPNALFRQHGLIQTDEAGNVTAWDAWFHCNGMSGMVYLREPDNEVIKNRVYTLLEETFLQGESGIGSILTKEEAEIEHLEGAFSFVLDTDGHTAFDMDYMGEYMKNLEEGKLKGSHGYHPDYGPRSPFIGKGPAFRTGAVLENAQLVDGATTYARILGVDLPDAQGCVLEELLA